MKRHQKIVAVSIALLAWGAILNYVWEPTPPTRQEEIKAILAQAEPHPRTFCPPATDRKFWETVQKSEGTPKKEGPPKNKIETENPTFPKEQALFLLSKGTQQECIYHTGEWLPTIEQSIKTLLQSPWSDLHIFQEEFTDLFATGTAAGLAFTLHQLQGELDPNLVAATKQKIFERVIYPYINNLQEYQRRPLYWNRDACPWLETKNNWNAVCISNIVYTVLAISPDLDLQAKIIAGSEEALQDYFATFEKDGYLSSGIRYWNYGFSHLVFLAERLLLASNGKINLYKMSPIIDKIVEFPLKWEVYQKDGKFYYPLFADNRNPVGQSWAWNILKHRFSLPFTPPKTNQWNEGNPILDLLLNPPAEDEEKTIVLAANPHHTLFESSGTLISKNGLATAAIKGGTNHEEHNHNDIGSYSIFLEGELIIGDAGSIPYTTDTWERRYSYDLQNSYGHPLPVIDGQLQHNETKAKVKVLSSALTDAADQITYDITNAYNVEGLNSLIRTFTFKRNPEEDVLAEITVEDKFEASRPINFETAIISSGRLFPQGTTLSILTGKEETFLFAKGSEPIEITCNPLQKVPGSLNNFTRGQIALKNKTDKGNISYTLQIHNPRN